MPGTLRLLLPALALCCATACGGGAGQDPDPAASASPSVEATVEPSVEPSAGPLECEDYPLDMATALLTDPASGEQRYAGEVTKAVSVRNTALAPDLAPTYAIAIDVEGKSFVLVHPIVDGTESATGPGPYAAITANTAEVTGQPEDAQIEQLAGEAVNVAVGCLTD